MSTARSLQDQDYGGRNCSAQDIEDNVSSFGSYDPWAETKARNLS